MVDVSDSEGFWAWLNGKPREFTCASRPARRYPIASAPEAKACQKGCTVLGTSCSLVGRSSHASLIRDHVERLDAGRAWTSSMRLNPSQQLFEMFRLHLAACPEHHFPEFELATEWPEVNFGGLAGLVEVDYAPVLRFVCPVLELGSE